MLSRDREPRIRRRDFLSSNQIVQDIVADKEEQRRTGPCIPVPGTWYPGTTQCRIVSMYRYFDSSFS